MQYKYIVLSTIIYIFSSFATFDNNLIGHWTGIDKGEVGEVDFDKNGFVFFILKGQKQGGKDFKVNDNIMSMYYETDTKSKPFKIDFVVRLNKTNEFVDKMVGIYEFIDKNKLRLQINFDTKERPNKFVPNSEDNIVLSKATN